MGLVDQIMPFLSLASTLFTGLGQLVWSACRKEGKHVFSSR